VRGSESAQMSYDFGRGEDKDDSDRGRTWMAGGSGQPTASARRTWVHAGQDTRPWAIVGH
jgi:hypothetical protein